MPKLTFSDQLNEEQRQYAHMIGEKAVEMGIPPELAISIAYHESRLNPNAPRGSSGEFGIMQVMPATGKGMGFTNKDLADPNKNIEAGLKYLKQNLDAFGGDAKLATIGYNAGIDSPFFSGGKLPETTENYLKSMKAYGAYSDGADSQQAQGSTTAASETPATNEAPDSNAEAKKADAERDARMQAAMDAQEKRQAQILGGGVGLGISGTKVVGSGAGAVLQGAANRVGQGFRAGMQGGLGALEPNADKATRILQGPMGDQGTTSRARMQGFNEQTSHEAKIRKEMEKLFAQLKQSGVVAEDAPAVFAKQPGMTSTESGVLHPRSDAPQTLGPRGPQGQIGFTRPPVASPSIFSKALGGLEYVGNIFQNMMKPLGVVVKHAVPPLALASAAGEGVNIAQQARKPEDQRDTTGMALSGANILGAGLSMIPRLTPIGIPITIGTAAAQAYRDSPEAQAYVQKKIQGLSDTPISDPMTGFAP